MHLAARNQDAARLQTVDFAEFHGFYPDLASQIINALFQPSVQFGHAKAAHRPTDRMIGVNAVAVGVHIRHFVRAAAAVAGSTSHVHAVFGVSSPVPVELVLHSQQATILVAAHFEIAY